MTTRRASLSYLIFMPVLAHGAPAVAGNRWCRADCDNHNTGPSYRTQPGTTALAPRYSPPDGADANLRLAWWNEVASSTLALDATPALPGQASSAAEQPGPTRSSRAMAIVHLAIFDALNAIRRRYRAYAAPLTAYADSSFDAAIAQATHDTLAALFPRQAARIDALLRQDLARLPGGRATLNGIEVGRKAADAILQLRSGDGSETPDPAVGEDFIPGDAPGCWRPDPVSRNPVALGAYWGRVKPFVLASGAQFRIAPVPALASRAYGAAFDDVKRLGADGIHTATVRTLEQTAIGIFWGYDGSAWVGPRPRQYNQIAVQLALARTRDPLDLARVLALANVAIADGAIAAWDSKYHWQLWRPVTAIREASPGSGPSGRGDGNPATRGDPAWTPLGAPASNLIGPNFTPPFPACPSGHATLGSAMFQVMRAFYGEATAFTLLSDEFNGVTRDNRGRVRPRLLRSYASLGQAEEENARSRIYLGVHWDFDMMEGMTMGRRVGEYVLRRGLVQPGA